MIMKRIVLFSGILFFSLTMSKEGNAQFFKKLADHVADRVEDKVINDAGDQAVKGVDKAEKGAEDAVTGKDKKGKATPSQKNNSKNSSPAQKGNQNVPEGQ